MTRWHVVLSDPAGVAPGALAPWFAARKALAPIDAQRAARHAWGFLAENLTESEAQAARADAAAMGLPAVCLPDERLRLLPDPSPVSGLQKDGPALRWTSGAPPAPLSAVDAASIRLLSFASIRHDALVTKVVKEQASGARRLAGLGIMLTTGIPVGMGGTTDVARTVTSTEWIVFLDVFGEGNRWRVTPERFDFSSLGAEKGVGGPANTRRLLEALRAAAPGALINRGARTFLAGQPLSGAGYDDLDDVEKESRWLLALAK